MRRIAVTAAMGAVFVIACATPAYAHSVAGVGATNYRTTLRDVSPRIPGLSVRVIEAGSRLELSYTGDRTIYVLGYQAERYLRIDGRGVFENLNSPTTYINKTRDGVSPPGSADAMKEPKWEKVASGRVARWHEHRAHFMGDVDPPAVKRAPEQRHVIQADWKVSITDGTTTAVASGDLVWIPGPSPVPYWLTAAALVVAVVLIGQLRSPHAPIAVVTAALVVADMFHSYAIGFANGGTTGTRVGQTFAASIVSIPAWLVGLGGAWMLLKRRVDGFFAVVFCALIITVVSGVADMSRLSRSQVPFALPEAFARPAVVMSLGLGIGLALASGLAIRRFDPRPKATDDAPALAPT